jgi:cell wall-associated NlpC family hydrolase
VAPVPFPQPGQFGLVRSPGIVGKLIDVAQRLIGSGSYYTHAFVVVGGGMVVQSEASGAVLASLDSAVNGRKVAYSALPLTDRQRADICSAALALDGTPYGYLDYPAIAAARLLHTDALERYVTSTGHMICSQLVDEAYRRAGVELFPGRIAGDVTPGDLARLIGA